MVHTADDMASVIDELTDKFGDKLIVDESGRKVTFIDYDRANERYVIEVEK